MKDVSLSELEHEFRSYLQDVRCYSQDSIRRHGGTLSQFARFLTARRVRSVQRVSLDLAYAFLEQGSRGNSRRHAKALHQGLRSVLRFLHFAGYLGRDLSETMMAPGMWKLADLPRAYSEPEIERMRGHLRSETAYDHRERLVMLLLITYGLRLGEVTRLSLDDLDFERKTITVRERKNVVPLILPMLPDIEGAIGGYLTHFRPAGLRTRRLFVTIKRKSRAPSSQMAIHEVVKKFLRRCGLEGSSIRFRHTLATHLINRGVSLEAIQAVLGHRHSDSTRIYAKVHWEALREVAENDSLLL